MGLEEARRPAANHDRLNPQPVTDMSRGRGIGGEPPGSAAPALGSWQSPDAEGQSTLEEAQDFYQSLAESKGASLLSKSFFGVVPPDQGSACRQHIPRNFAQLLG